MAHDCKQDSFIKSIEKRLERIEDKVDSLVKYKWQIMGGAIVIWTVLGFSTTIFFKLL
jgi:tetrahydromethanopterin S-methyltransferase subunit G